MPIKQTDTNLNKHVIAICDQDHLNEQFLNSEFLTSDLYLSRTWLTDMGTAAANHGVKIEYCMALPRQAYQSLEIPTVTQVSMSRYAFQSLEIPTITQVSMTRYAFHSLQIPTVTQVGSQLFLNIRS